MLRMSSSSRFGKLGMSGFDEVEEMTQRAIALDPDFGLAHALMANAVAMRASMTPKASDRDVALKAAEKAMILEPDDPIVLSYAANALVVIDTSTYALLADISVGTAPWDVAVAPDLLQAARTILAPNACASA